MPKGLLWSDEVIDLITWIRDNPHHEAGFCNRRGYLPRDEADETHFFLRGSGKKIVPLAVWREVAPLIEVANWRERGRMYDLSKSGQQVLRNRYRRLAAAAAQAMEAPR